MCGRILPAGLSPEQWVLYGQYLNVRHILLDFTINDEMSVCAKVPSNESLVTHNEHTDFNLYHSLIGSVSLKLRSEIT